MKHQSCKTYLKSEDRKKKSRGCENKKKNATVVNIKCLECSISQGLRGKSFECSISEGNLLFEIKFLRNHITQKSRQVSTLIFLNQEFFQDLGNHNFTKPSNKLFGCRDHIRVSVHQLICSTYVKKQPVVQKQVRINDNSYSPSSIWLLR